MKTFILTVECENVDQLKTAFQEAITELDSNGDEIETWDVDVEWDITAGGVKEITLARIA